jgi:PIN domain nuclease of toxin-antitoxin system
MNVLLDTHAFLWWIADDPRLSQTARDAISDPDNEILVSAASAWEIAIKVGIGRLTVPAPAKRFVPSQVQRNGFVALPIQFEHALGAEGLPRHHKDPFDRMLVAQARAEKLILVTDDPLIQRYNVETLW